MELFSGSPFRIVFPFRKIWPVAHISQILGYVGLLLTLGTAAFRNSLVSRRWASLHPEPRSRVFCSIDRFVSGHDFGLGGDLASSHSVSMGR
jgi:hypothetical protein